VASRVYATLEDLRAHVGEEVGVSSWLEVDQARIDRFADATGDHQWIHVDPARAAAGPYGATVAHGFLTLSLVPQFLYEAVQVSGSGMGVNYGLNKVRFPAPVPVGSRLRARFRLLECTPLSGPPEGMHLVMEVTLEREGGTRPVCVAEMVSRRYV
jgi:acyl dehydratase